jgi:MerR family redox-sensitive transcriptional activator SoxR
MDSVLTIGEVSRRRGVASSALRFYEECGLVSSVRAGSGHRRYPRSVLRRIAFIVFAQRIGLTLEEIGRELAKLPADRIPARLGAPVRRMDEADRSKDRRATAS